MALSCTIERGKTYFYSDKLQSALCIFGMLGVAAVHICIKCLKAHNQW